MVDVVQEEMRDLLKKHDYNPDETAFIRGSALSALQGTNDDVGSKKI